MRGRRTVAQATPAKGAPASETASDEQVPSAESVCGSAPYANSHRPGAGQHRRDAQAGPREGGTARAPQIAEKGANDPSIKLERIDAAIYTSGSMRPDAAAPSNTIPTVRQLMGAPRPPGIVGTGCRGPRYLAVRRRRLEASLADIGMGGSVQVSRAGHARSLTCSGDLGRLASPSWSEVPNVVGDCPLGRRPAGPANWRL